MTFVCSACFHEACHNKNRVSFSNFRTSISFVALLLVAALAGCGGSGNSLQNVGVSISPPTANAYETKSVTFAATVTGTTNTAVTWSVQEGAAGGTVSGGIYTAPATPGTYHVVATSQANSGKSATAAVTVTAGPQPTFSSTAPTTAVEGQAYTYNLTAADPAGGTVTFTVTSGPTNATISGDILSWTPTHAQSRTSNAFVIQAASSEGGVAEQDFAVTPNGTINGIYAELTYTESGKVTVPQQPQTVNAYVLGANGNYTAIAGTGSNGGFSIANVPAGYYMLDVDGQYLWTSASDLDLTYPWIGRANPTYPTQDTMLTVNFTEGAPQYPDDACSLFVPNGYSALSDSPCSGELWNQSYDLLFYGFALPDASQGDLTYVYRVQPTTLAGGTWTGYALTDYAGQLSLTIPDGGNVMLSGAMTAEPPNASVRANLDVSDFVSLEPLVSPSPSYWAYYNLTIYVQPFTGDYFLGIMDCSLTQNSGGICDNPTPHSLVLGPNTEDGQNIDLGDVPYANPFPNTWVPYAAFAVIGELPYTADGAAQPYPFLAGVGTFSTQMPTGNSPIAPLVGQATSITINGGDFYSDQPNAGAQPVVAWNPPTVGTADGYILVVFQLTSDGYQTFPGQTFAIETGKTSVTIPPDVLQSGYAYVFRLITFHGTPNLETAPDYSYFPFGWADAFSGYIHVSPGSAPAKGAAISKQTRVPRQLLRGLRGGAVLRPARGLGLPQQPVGRRR